MIRQPSLGRKPLSAGMCIVAIALLSFLKGPMVGTLHAAADTDVGKVHIDVVGDDKQPLPCRIHIFDEAGKPQQAGKLPFWKDHFVCPGSVTLELPIGKYSFDIERGPEYERLSGVISVKSAGTLKASFTLTRIANLAADGWWSGDLHVHRRLEDIELLMRAEDLHVAPVITWWNNRNLWSNRQLPAQQLVRFDKNRLYHVMAGEDERQGGALLYFNLREPLPITGSKREYPSPMKFLNAARQKESKQQRVWVDIEKPFWWDVPVWLASGQTDTIGLANNHMCRSRMYESEAWGRPRDIKKLPAPRGNGYWTQQIYYHILNCGLRVPPSAGSASGVLPNPVGYNRVYVHLGEKLDYDQWWQGLKAGRSFVTNGPLLLCRANGKLPGHVFTSAAGEPISVAFDASIITNDAIASLEIIKNGKVAQTIKFNEKTKSVSLEPIEFQESGWFLVRAIADNKRTFRFASTAPFYVEVGASKHHVSRESVQFFIDWINERRQRVKLNDAAQRREVLQHHKAALRYWTTRLQSANSK